MLKTCIVHSQRIFSFQFYFSRILLGFLRFTRPLKAFPGEDGRWGGRRGEMGVIPRSGCRSTGLALWVFSHIAGDNKSQHDLTPPFNSKKGTC